FLAPSADAVLAALRAGIRVPAVARKHDILHVHGEAAAAICLPSVALRPSVVTLHGLHLLRRLSGARRGIAASTLRVVVRAASVTICVSHAEREDVVAAVGAKEGRRLTVIHNGIEIAQAPTASERAAVRDGLGLAPEQIVGVFAGSLDRRKDPLVAAHAAA